MSSQTCHLNMELLNNDDIFSIVKQYGYKQILKWTIEDYSTELMGYLGEHLRLKLQVASEVSDSHTQLIFFVKCMPRFDKGKAEYIKELMFFEKEFVMLSKLFKNFTDDSKSKWRPKLLLIKEDVFVFEDVTEIDYVMLNCRDTLTYEEMTATIEALSKFHAQSYIFEEKRSRQLGRSYRIWEDYSDYLKEPPHNQSWRDTGRNAVIDFLKVYSKYGDTLDFSRKIEIIIPMLFSGAMELMKPSSLYRNVVIHRDLWMNNILFRRNYEGKINALIVDFQTVLYSSPMLDISSLLFFNTTKDFRSNHTNEILNLYYRSLSEELNGMDIDINTIMDKATLVEAYEQSVLFGITQAALIVPIVTMENKKRKELFSNPNTLQRINTVSRSQEFIKEAREHEIYRNRVTDLFDDIVERYLNKST